MKETFKELGLNEELLKGLENLDIKAPTEIQDKVYDIAKDGKNIIAQSETGTGKTLAYLLPILEQIDTTKQEIQCIILAPTHELGVQINNVILDLKKNSNLDVTSTTLVGSGNITRQIEKLKSKPNVVIGSAGRILELIKKKKVTAHTIKTLVIDEGDKLLDFRNIEEVRGIIKACQRDTQKMIFSATLTPKTLEVAQKIIGDSEIIQVKNGNRVNENITHNYFVVDHREQVEYLRKLIHASKANKAIVFINKSYDVNMTLSKLRFNKINAEALHGTNKKEERQNALEAFRKGKIQVLVASDLAARGLDIKGITHIINLDIPENPKDYLHRVGRVGRAGETGIAYSIVDPKEEELIKLYERTFNITIDKKFVYEGNIVDKIVRGPKPKKIKIKESSDMKKKSSGKKKSLGKFGKSPTKKNFKSK